MTDYKLNEMIGFVVPDGISGLPLAGEWRETRGNGSDKYSAIETYH